ncbi:trafficking protein particle complex subunit, partial [Haematococcus lacustris]
MDGRQRIMYNAPTAQRPATPQLEQISSEIFTLMYGSIVRQLIADLEDLDEVNKQLEKMGYNIGIRLVDEFLAKARISRCNNFKETMEVIGKQAFFMFLGIQASVTNWSPDGMECTLYGGSWWVVRDVGRGGPLAAASGISPRVIGFGGMAEGMGRQVILAWPWGGSGDEGGSAGCYNAAQWSM